MMPMRIQAYGPQGNDIGPRVLTTIDKKALALQKHFHLQNGVHLIYEVEKKDKGVPEKSSVKPFPGFRVEYLVRFVEDIKNFSLCLGNQGCPGVELGYRDEQPGVKGGYYMSHCIDTDNEIIESFSGLDPPQTNEAMWFGIGFESNYIVRGFVNNVELGIQKNVHWENLDRLHYFNASEHHSSTLLEIHLHGQPVANIFRLLTWNDCDLYALFSGATVQFKCRVKDPGTNSCAFLTLRNESGQAEKTLKLPIKEGDESEHTFKLSIGDRTSELSWSGGSTVVSHTELMTREQRQGLSFSANLVLSDVFMVCTVPDKSVILYREATIGDPWRSLSLGHHIKNEYI